MAIRESKKDMIHASLEKDVLDMMMPSEEVGSYVPSSRADMDSRESLDAESLPSPKVEMHKENEEAETRIKQKTDE